MNECTVGVDTTDQKTLIVSRKEHTWCRSRVKELEEEVEKLQQWVNDLQAGMYINCVYCGHRYGPDDEVPASMADVLKEHIEQCPKHSMSALKAELEKLRKEK